MYNFPLSNTAIAEQVDVLGKLMDVFGENAFKVKTYTSAAYIIKKSPQNFKDLTPEQIQELKIIGSSVKTKVLELLNTNTIKELEELKTQTPEGVLAMMQIKGLGPKKIALLWKELEITSIGELEYACQENRLMTFKGFGKKTQDDILNKIQFIRNNQGLYLWKEIDDEWQNQKDVITAFFEDYTLDITGAYKRQLPVLDSLEILTTAPVQTIQTFLNNNGFEKIATAENEVSACDNTGILWKWHSTIEGQFGIIALTKNSSQEFLEAFKNQYAIPETANDEAAIFNANDCPFIPAYLRESGDITSLSARALEGNIITTESIKGIIHSHSTWSDGQHSIKEMAEAAIAMGMEYLVISDHSKSAFYANGLSVERIQQQHQEIEALNKALAPFKIFKSIEADILNDGSLDYEDEVLAQFDLVIASIHSNLNMNEEKAMMRLIKAIENPYTTILGHPTGRLLLSRPGYPIHHTEVIAACKKHHVVIEINAHPRRLDLDWKWIDKAQNEGVLLSINPDAHATGHLSLIQYGVKAAQKGGLQVSYNVSSMNLQEFETFLKTNKAQKAVH